MDADRAQDVKDPNDIFVNTPEGGYGPSSYTEMNMGYWVFTKLVGGVRWLARLITRER